MQFRHNLHTYRYHEFFGRNFAATLAVKTYSAHSLVTRFVLCCNISSRAAKRGSLINFSLWHVLWHTSANKLKFS